MYVKENYILKIFFFFNDTATTEIYTLSLHDALPIFQVGRAQYSPDPRHPFIMRACPYCLPSALCIRAHRSEEHTSELQSLAYLVCRLLLEKKKLFTTTGADGARSIAVPSCYNCRPTL